MFLQVAHQTTNTFNKYNSQQVLTPTRFAPECHLQGVFERGNISLNPLEDGTLVPKRTSY